MLAKTLDDPVHIDARPRGRASLVVSAVSGVALAVVAVLWWAAYAPLAEVDAALGGVTTAAGTSEYDGALVMPIMLCGAAVAATLSWAVGHRQAPRAAIITGVVLATVALLLGTVFDRVAHEMATSAPENIAGMPFAPEGIGAWAVVFATVASIAAVGAARARVAEASLLLTALIVLAYGTLAAELFRSGDSRASHGFALISAAAGVWLAFTVWELRRLPQAPR